MNICQPKNRLELREYLFYTRGFRLWQINDLRGKSLDFIFYHPRNSIYRPVCYFRVKKLK